MTYFVYIFSTFYSTVYSILCLKIASVFEGRVFFVSYFLINFHIVYTYLLTLAHHQARFFFFLIMEKGIEIATILKKKNVIPVHR